MRGGKRPNSGRKKGYKAIEAEKAREYILSRVLGELEPIITKQIEQAKKGDNNTRRDLFDRAFGKPKDMERKRLGGLPIYPGLYLDNYTKSFLKDLLEYMVFYSSLKLFLLELFCQHVEHPRLNKS